MVSVEMLLRIAIAFNRPTNGMIQQIYIVKAMIICSVRFSNFVLLLGRVVAGWAADWFVDLQMIACPVVHVTVAFAIKLYAAVSLFFNRCPYHFVQKEIFISCAHSTEKAM